MPKPAGLKKKGKSLYEIRIENELRAKEVEYRHLSDAYQRLIEQYRNLDDQYMRLDASFGLIIHKKMKEFINSYDLK